MLGGLRFLGYDDPHITDINDVKSTCTLAVSTVRSSSVSNLPVPGAAARIMSVSIGTDCFHLAFVNTSESRALKYRVYNGEWTPWRNISYT